MLVGVNGRSDPVPEQHCILPFAADRRALQLKRSVIEAEALTGERLHPMFDGVGLLA